MRLFAFCLAFACLSFGISGADRREINLGPDLNAPGKSGIAAHANKDQTGVSWLKPGMSGFTTTLSPSPAAEISRSGHRGQKAEIVVSAQTDPSSD